MSSRHIRPPSPALAVALLALFVSVGGTSYAVKKISSRDIVDGAIKSIDIRNGEIRSADVRDGSLRAKDFARGELPSGTAGARGPAGPAGRDGRHGRCGLCGRRGAVRARLRKRDAGPRPHDPRDRAHAQAVRAEPRVDSRLLLRPPRAARERRRDG